MSNSSSSLWPVALILSAGIAVSGYFVSQTLFNAKVAINTAEAKGLAERKVRADNASWNIGFEISGEGSADLKALYAESEGQQQTITQLLLDNGFEQGELEVGVLEHRLEEFRDAQQKLVDSRHVLTGSIRINTDKVEQVAKARSLVNQLIAEGIAIQNHAPVYRFTGLNEIKLDMLREATKNARIAASEFATNAGAKVGGIRQARQGNFEIRDYGEDWGNTAKLDKNVRVVTTITFYLTE